MKPQLKIPSAVLISLWLIVLGVLITSRILISGDKSILPGFDNSVQFYAWYAYAARSFAQGALPLWDPYQLSGHSFIGEMQVGLFYPPNLLMFLILGKIDPETYHRFAPSIIEVFALLGLIGAGLFTYWMLREFQLSKPAALVGATVFAYAGFVFDRQFGQLCIFNSVLWIPFIFAAYLRSCKQTSVRCKVLWLNTAGLGVGMTILSGHYLGFVYGVLSILTYAVYRSLRVIIQEKKPLFSTVFSHRFLRGNFLAIAWLVLFGLLVSSIQLIPTIEYSRLSLRWVSAESPVGPGEKIPYTALANQFHFSLGGLFSLFNPDLSTLNLSTLDGFLYSGIVALILAIFAIWKYWKSNSDVIFFTILWVVSLFYSLGGDSLLHAGYNLLLPFSDPVRTASRASCLSHFAIAVLSAWGVQAIIEENSASSFVEVAIFRRVLQYSLLSCVGLVLVALFIKLDAKYLVSSLLMTGFLTILVSLLLIFYYRIDKPTSTHWWILSICLTLLIAQDTYYFLVNRSPDRQYEPPALLYPPKVLMANIQTFSKLEDAKQDYRVANQDIGELKNFGDLLGIKMTLGHGASMPKNYLTFLSDLGWNNQRINDLLSVRYRLKPRNSKSQKDLQVLNNPSALPIYRLYYDYEVFPNQTKARERLNSDQFNYRTSVILQKNPDWSVFPATSTISNPLNPPKLKLQEFSPNLASFAIESNQPGVLVYADQMYPGWSASVNGIKVDIIEADTVFKAVPIPSGNSLVTFKYQPASVIFGAIATLIAVGFYSVSWFVHLSNQYIQARRTL